MKKNILKNFSKLQPRLDEDLTTRIMQRIENERPKKPSKVFALIRAISSSAALLLLVLLGYLEYNSLDQSNIHPSEFKIEWLKNSSIQSKEDYLAHLQKNFEKNEQINNLRKQLNK